MGTKKCDNCHENDGDYYCSCIDCYSQIVINGLLAYVSTYRLRASRLQLKMAIQNFYDETDMNEAKRMLCEAVTKVGIDPGNAASARQNSQNRSAKEAAADDILDIFQKIDGKAEEDVIKFYVEDISKLPPAAPEAGGNMMTMFEAISKQASQLQQLQDSVAEMNKTVMKNSEDIRGITSRNYARATVEGQNVAEWPSVGATAAGVRPTEQRPPGIPRKNAPSRKMSTRDVSDEEKLAEAIKDIEVPSTSDDGFTVVQNKKKKPKEGLTKLRQRPKCGAASGGRTFAGPDVFHVQLTNVHASVDEDALKDFINGKDGGIELKEIKDASSAGWDTKRFIVSFDIKNLETVLKEDFWPERIYYKRWYTPRGSNSQAKGGMLVKQ